MIKNKLTWNPIHFDKDIYYACFDLNEKYKDTDNTLGGILSSIRTMRGSADGLEHTSFNWEGKTISILKF